MIKIKENMSDLVFEDLVNQSNGISTMPTYVWIYVIIFGCATIVGSFGNALVIGTIALSKVLRKSVNSFIVSLALADFMVSTITMPSSIAGIMYGRRWFEDRNVLCSVISTICAPGCVASMYSIAWIAISRYYYIGEFAKYLTFFSPKHIVCYVFSIWLLSYAVHLPNHLGWGRTHYSLLVRFCTLDADVPSYARFYTCILLFAIFVAFMYYLKTYLIIRKSKLTKRLIIGEGHANSSSMANEIKIIKTSFKIFFLFLITWSPLAVLLLLQIDVPAWVYMYAGLIAHCNSTLNFVVYFLENTVFRNAAKDCFMRCFKRKNKVQSVCIDLSTVTTKSFRPTEKPAHQLLHSKQRNRLTTF